MRPRVTRAAVLREFGTPLEVVDAPLPGELPPGAHRIGLGDAVPDTWAASAGCAVKTVVRAFATAGGVEPGATVVVPGAGPLGLVATAYARATGAGRVITLGGPANRAAPAARLRVGRPVLPARRAVGRGASDQGHGVDGRGQGRRRPRTGPGDT